MQISSYSEMIKMALRTFPPLASKSRISLKYCPSMMLRRARAWDLQKNSVIVHLSKSHEPDISIIQEQPELTSARTEYKKIIVTK